MFLRSMLMYKELRPFRNFSTLIKTPPLTQDFDKKHIKFFMKALDITKLQTYNILAKYPNLQSFDLGRMDEAHKILMKLGFSKTDIKDDPNVLGLIPTSIEQHIMILQEVGYVNINTTCVRSYLTLGRKRISLLKAHGYLPDDLNVKDHLLKFLENSFVMSPSIEINDSFTVNAVRNIVLYEYLKWRLEMSNVEVDHLFKTYNRIKNKSLRIIRRSLTQLEEIGFTKEKIKRHGYLIYSHPENTEKLLSKIPEIAGQDILQVILKHPKLLMSNWETFIKTSKHLRDFNIPDSSIRKCMDIFTLSSESVYERLRDLQTIPEFKVFCSHPRILKLVHHQKKAKSRLDYLQEMRVKCASLHVLSSTRWEFEKYAREGSDRTKGKDCVAFLMNAFGLSSQELREYLNRHSFWCHVPLITIESTLDMLKKRNYLNKHIIHNIHLLLYPKHQVESILEELNSKRTHPELPDIENLSKLPREKILSLCLYILEKKHHFTGNGVWDEFTQQDITTTIDANTPLPQATIGKNINHRYLLDQQ